MIVFDHVSVSYGPGGPAVLRDVDFTIADGQLVLVAGRTGAGKSTLLGAINGHVPHFTGGTLTGRVLVEGLDTATHRPRELAHVIGVVNQDPLAGFVTDTVESELAYGMEQLGVAPQVMRTRVEETLDILGLADLRRRALASLSGGQQQRVAIGSVLATGVRVLVLDEPTSALDPVSAEEVLATVVRLVDDLGLTVVIAEHRLERVVGYADRVILLAGGGQVVEGETRQVMAASPLVPPVVDLGRRAGFVEVPLTVRQARRQAGGLRKALSGLDPEQYSRIPGGGDVSVSPLVDSNNNGGTTRNNGGTTRDNGGTTPHTPRAPFGRSQIATGVDTDPRVACDPGTTGLVTSKLRVAYGRTVVVHDVSISFPAGQITVVMGRNGSGKSSLLWALTGVAQAAAGSFAVDGRDLGGLPPEKVRQVLRLVPQSASDLLYLSTVAAECLAADHDSGGQPGDCQRLLESLAPGIDPASHPRDLSEGQKLCLVLAIQLTARPQVILLDEPTRGLDYPAKAALAQILTGMASVRCTVGVVTHDVEFAAEVADQIVVLASGEVIQTGTATEVLGASALFASQVAKVLHPSGWLTAHQVGQALAEAGELGES